ncbi:MAG: diguanylate cyclase [Saccharofermentans sp.]|nr:diguanylate cyclase [Saccharofermentans sp.]
MSDSYKLVWADEFDADEFDSSSWNIECHEPHWINQELQEYTDNKKIVFIKDSCAVIRPEKTINSDGSVSYYSGYLTTNGLKTFTYGRFEARIKIPSGRGFLPAFKLISDQEIYGEWPRSGDIGIMEILGQEPTKNYSTVRFGAPIAQRQGTDHIYDGRYCDGFHVYACEWNPDEISFFIDGKKFFSTGYWFSQNPDGSEIAPYPAPFNKPFAICLNLSIGSTWAGEPDIKTKYGDSAQMYIDYVRVYQKDEYDENVTRPVKELNMRPADETGNLLLSDSKDWEFQLHRNGNGNCSIVDDEFVVDISDVGDEVFSIQVLQGKVPLVKGETYCLSFDACAESPRTISAAVTAPDVGWAQYLPYRSVYLDSHYQRHNIYIDMKYDTDDNARVEFNLGNTESLASVKIKNIRLEKISKCEDKRKVIAVCGVWEDAENFNQFISAMQTPEIANDYVVAGVTFGSVMLDFSNEEVMLRLVDYISEMDLAAIIMFVEMLESKKVVDALVALAKERQIPIFSFEHDVDGCINSSYDYRSGFKQMVDHVIEEHDCKIVHMFAGNKGNPFSDEREEIFKQSLLEHGLTYSEENIFHGDFWDARAELVMQELIDNGYEMPDAIVCANDSMAVGVCDCLMRNGILVPQQVVVTGFDGIREAKMHNPGISTCEPDYEGIVSMIMGTISEWSPNLTGVTQKKITHYIPKFDSSCGCPASRNQEWFDVVSRLSKDNQDYFRHMLEMGHFVSRSINMESIDDAAMELRHYLWLWTDYYYFIGINNHAGCIHGIFAGVNGEFSYRNKYYNYPTTAPDIDLVLKKGGKFNIILAKQIRSNDESWGLMVQAYDKIDLRDEQRFEEFSLYMSSVVSAVINKNKLIGAMSKIEHLSESDYLTGLYNRRGFLKKVQEMIDDPKNMGSVISVFSIDMDGLKTINDNYGHNDGDCAIKALARSLKAYVGNRGICARYGGDEFAICIVGDRELLPDFVNIHDRIRNHCATDPELEDKSYEVDASIGISERRIRAGINLEDLISFSDTAMYIDKQSRKMK